MCLCVSVCLPSCFFCVADGGRRILGEVKCRKEAGGASWVSSCLVTQVPLTALENRSPPKSQTHLYMCIMLAAPFPDRYTSGAAVSALLCQEQIPFAHDFRYIGDLPKQKKHSWKLDLKSSNVSCNISNYTISCSLFICRNWGQGKASTIYLRGKTQI